MPNNQNQQYKDTLDLLRFQYGVDKIYSWSRINCFLEDKWTYFLKYVLKIKPDRADSIYGTLGTALHTQMEEFYTTNIDNKTMTTNFESAYIAAKEMFGRSFVYVNPNADEETKQACIAANEKLARKFVNSVKHFLTNVVKDEGLVECEKFYPCVLTDSKGKNYLIQCFIDFLNWKEDGKVDIIDYKTSTFYQNAKAEKLKRQLEFYALAFQQNENIPISDINLAWNFVKYIQVEYPQANGKFKSRRLERDEIGGVLNPESGMYKDGLQSALKTIFNNAKKFNLVGQYSEDEINEYLYEVGMSNSLDCLPEEVKKLFTFSNCLRPIEYNEAEKIVLEGFIVGTIKEIEHLEELYEQTKDENLWWQDVTYDDVYRLENLSEYSPRLHKPYQAYLQAKKEREEAGDTNPEIIGGSAFNKLWGAKANKQNTEE
nr:MAG TPA: PD-(D/E)XK nuclease superfamily protein [Caudoviricetes sp.]